MKYSMDCLHSQDFNSILQTDPGYHILGYKSAHFCHGVYRSVYTICLFPSPVEKKWIQLCSLGIGTNRLLFSNALQLLLSVQAVQRLTVSLISKGSFFYKHQKVQVSIKCVTLKEVTIRNIICFYRFCVSPLEFFPERFIYIVTPPFQPK